MTGTRPAYVITNARVLDPAPTRHTAVMITSDGRIGGLGADDSAWPDAVRRVDVGAALVTPAFVDAHVHTVQTGQLIAGLDLSVATSAADLLELLSVWVAAHPGEPVLGHGWDDTTWPAGPPARTELDRVAGTAVVYLSRVDVHSAIASTALVERADALARRSGTGLTERAGWTPTGPVSQDAHHLIRAAVDGCFDDARRRAFARAALQAAAAAGIGTVHEMGGPHLGPIDDLDRVRDAAAGVGLDVVGYWGEPATAASLARARDHGAAGLAGDLCVDGAIGSRTAALTSAYADHPGSGVRYLDSEQITDHLVACTRAGVQAGFHCIGDRAVADVVTGLRHAARAVGADTVRRCRHRLEHVEMVTPAAADTLAELGVVASVQPVFDAWWGGTAGLYRIRLGDRAETMNPFRTLAEHGVALAFGSDAPVTPHDGWGAVRAARQHHRPAERLTGVAALAAHTVGGHHAAGPPPDHASDHASDHVSDHVSDRASERDGRLTPGAPATLAIWQVDPTHLDGDGVPELAADQPDPTCRATLVRGRVAYRADAVDGVELDLDPTR